MMDRLLDSRKVTVTEKDAVKSEEALIAYINQSDYGRWIINSYAHLSDTDKVTFRKGINEVLPYIADRELFISHIKYSMKSDMCRNLAYDCVMEDCMRMDNSPSILRKDGFEFLYDKYKDKIYTRINIGNVCGQVGTFVALGVRKSRMNVDCSFNDKITWRYRNGVALQI